ncbi:MAG: radical SAM protein [Candidatus Omnitrophica bacterium]|nr:radical SAM protein [Candidatus Omnitrophota bacterium]
MKKLKILLQEPFVPREVTYGKFAKGAGTNTFSYGMACLATYIKERGYDVYFLDPNLKGMNQAEYKEFLEFNKFDVIGIGSTTLQIDYALECFKVIKSIFPRTITVLGGVHATLMPQETICASADIDYLILGEGEKPFYHLLEKLIKGDIAAIKNISGVCYKSETNIIFNMPNEDDFLAPEEIPLPYFDIFSMREYVPQVTFAKAFPSYTVIASRGCPFQCAFCNASATVGKKVRLRQPESLLEEIRILKEKYGAKGIMFLDSTFTINKSWLTQFCRAYIQSGLNLPWAANSRVDTVDKDLLMLMKEAGCWNITFGIESANQKSLDLIDKGTTVQQNTSAIQMALRIGFNVYTSHIICLPGETEDDADNTIRYARSMGNHMAMFYLPVPFPKTKLNQICRDTGGLREGAAWRDYNAWDYSKPVYVSPILGKEKMFELYKKAYISFYSNPVVWYRNAKDMVLLKQNPYRFWLGLKSFFSFIFHR